MPPSDDLTDVELDFVCDSLGNRAVAGTARRAVAELRRLRADVAGLTMQHATACKAAEDMTAAFERASAERATAKEQANTWHTRAEAHRVACEAANAEVARLLTAPTASPAPLDVEKWTRAICGAARAAVLLGTMPHFEEDARRLVLEMAGAANPAPPTVTSADLARLHGLAEDMVAASAFDGHETLASRATKLVDDVLVDLLVDLRMTVTASPAPLTVAERAAFDRVTHGIAREYASNKHAWEWMNHIRVEVGLPEMEYDAYEFVKKRRANGEVIADPDAPDGGR